MVSGKNPPNAERRRPENRVRGRMADDVSVRVAERADPWDGRHPAEHERAVPRPGGAIVAGYRHGPAWPQADAPGRWRARAEWDAVVILMFGMAFDNPHRMLGPLGKRGFIGGLKARPLKRHGISQHVTPKRLRRLGEKICSRGSVSCDRRVPHRRQSVWDRARPCGREQPRSHAQ